MTLSDLQSQTVIQLRKIARENNIVLGAGVDKSTIIEKLSSALNLTESIPAQQSFLDLPEFSEAALPFSKENDTSADADLSSPKTTSAPTEDSAPSKSEPVEPRFQAAWHSADSPQNLNSASHSPVGINRPAWQNSTPSGRPLNNELRPQPLRPHSFGPRFGPGPAVRADSPAPETSGASAVSPLPDHRTGVSGPGSFGPRSTAPDTSTPTAAASVHSSISDTLSGMMIPVSPAGSFAPARCR